MPQVINYCMLNALREDELREEVLALVAKGWEPQGGVSCAQIYLADAHSGTNAVWHYVQAMVKRRAAQPRPSRTRALSEAVYVIDPEEEVRESDE